MCLLITVKDITNEKIIDHQQVVDQLKNMIFKTFTHELKTPLNGITLSLDTCKYLSKKLTKNFSSNQKPNSQYNILKVVENLNDKLKVINSCTMILKHSMNDLFDYHQLQNNDINLNIE